MDSQKKKNTCQYCDKSFPSREKLQCHLVTDHFQVPQFDCPHCDRRFHKQCNLKNHVASVHDTKRPHMCVECFLKFETRDELDQHIDQTHGNRLTSEGLFDCEDCGAHMKNKTELSRHQVVHMEPLSYRIPLKCSWCRLDFSCLREMQEHRDKDHTCKVCGQVFDDKKGLEVHKLHYCAFCDYCYSNKEQHMADVHESIVCPSCKSRLLIK
jgi:KRAB domain-containing zinc finger protein